MKNIVLYFLFPSVICHVVGITYQSIGHRLLAEMLGDPLGKTNDAGALLNPPGNIPISFLNTDGLYLAEQTRRWRFGLTNTAGRKTNWGRSSSSTRKRASSPRTSWRKSTLRVSGSPFKAAAQSSVVNRDQTFWAHSAVCLLTGVSSIMATSQWHTHTHTHSHQRWQSPPGCFHQHLFLNKSNLSFTVPVCFFILLHFYKCTKLR